MEDVYKRQALNHDVTIPTCQLDFALPERFELEYIGEDGKAHRPVVIHRAVSYTHLDVYKRQIKKFHIIFF